MRRLLGCVMIAGLLFSGAACGKSDSSKDNKTTTTTGADSGDNGSGESSSGNADVKAYCKAVDAYVDKVKAAQSDPAKAATLADEGKDLSTKAGALATANLSADDAQAVADCTKKSTDALVPGS